MSSLYTPTIANNPSSLTMPSDGDAKPVASVRVALEGIADLAGRCRAMLTAVLPGASFINLALTGTTTVSGVIEGSGGFLNIGQPGETARFLGDTIAAGTLQVDGILTANAELLTNAELLVAGGLTLSSRLTPTSTGRIGIMKVVGVGGNANYSMSNHADLIQCDPAVSVTYSFKNAGAQDGDRWRISVVGATNTTNFVNVANDAGTNLITLRNDTGHPVWADINFDAGDWHVDAYGMWGF